MQDHLLDILESSHWLMSNQRRMEMIENREVHKWAEKRTTLATLDREYDFYEIATITRAAPARIYGFTDKGALTLDTGRTLLYMT